MRRRVGRGRDWASRLSRRGLSQRCCGTHTRTPGKAQELPQPRQSRRDKFWQGFRVRLMAELSRMQCKRTAEFAVIEHRRRSMRRCSVRMEAFGAQ